VQHAYYLGVRQRDRDTVHDADALDAGDAIAREHLAPILCRSGMNFVKFVLNTAKYQSCTTPLYCGKLS
jgi:hypothetical protein